MQRKRMQTTARMCRGACMDQNMHSSSHQDTCNQQYCTPSTKHHFHSTIYFTHSTTCPSLSQILDVKPAFLWLLRLLYAVHIRMQVTLQRFWESVGLCHYLLEILVFLFTDLTGALHLRLHFNHIQQAVLLLSDEVVNAIHCSCAQPCNLERLVTAFVTTDLKM